MYDLDAPMILSDEDVEKLRERENTFKASNSLEFSCCPSCSAINWRCATDDGKAETILRLSNNPCDRCAEFRFRYPDVYQFVMLAVQSREFIQKRLKRKEDTGK